MINNNKHGYLYFYSPDEFEVNFTIVNYEDFTLKGKHSEEDKTEIEVNFASSKDKYYILAEAKKNNKTKTLYFLYLPKEPGQRYQIRYNGITKKLKPYKFLDDDSKCKIIWWKKNGVDYFETSDSCFQITKFMNPLEAKRLWKYINNKHYVSKWIWDPYMGYYDHYCKACATGKWKSWLGNPDIGYVRDSGYIQIDTFEYKGKYYNPCAENEYNRLIFWTEEEYNTIRNTYKLNGPELFNKFEKEWPLFEQLWDIELVQEEIESNNNVTGGAWKLPDGSIKAKNFYKANTVSNNYLEKVVTLGMHNTRPENSIRCPVCEDIYNIMRSGWKGMLPFHLQIAEAIKSKIER